MNDTTQRRFGFVNFAETWNGRLAMLGLRDRLRRRTAHRAGHPQSARILSLAGLDKGWLITLRA